jgi:hypothetical protein
MSDKGLSTIQLISNSMAISVGIASATGMNRYDTSSNVTGRQKINNNSNNSARRGSATGQGAALRGVA